MLRREPTRIPLSSDDAADIETARITRIAAANKGKGTAVPIPIRKTAADSASAARKARIGLATPKATRPHTRTMLFLVLVEFALVGVLTGWLLHRYGSWRTIPPYAYITTFAGWFLSFCIVVLLPIDVSSTFYERGISSKPLTYVSGDTLLGVWGFMYWTSFLFTWIVIPLQQSYVEAGDFTPLAKLKTALRENAIFYGVTGVILVIFIIIIAASKGMDGASLMGFLIAGSNAWGLLITISLLGYGLVEIPRGFWHAANTELSLRHAEFRAVRLNRAREDAEAELLTTIQIINRVDEEVPRRGDIRALVDTLLSKVPAEYKDRAAAVVVDDSVIDDVMMDLSEPTCVALHRRILSAERNLLAALSRFDENCERAFWMEDLIDNTHNSESVIASPLHPVRGGRFGMQISKAEWYWNVVARPYVFRGVSIVLGGMSLALVWSECVLFLNDATKEDPHVLLSIFANIIRIPKTGAGLQLFSFLPLLYMCVCAYSSLFKLQLFSYYKLTRRQHSSANSLLFSAAYLSRLTAPLVYNYLLLLHEADEKDTAFSRFMGEMTVLPFFGTHFNDYFPLFVLVLCVCTAFNLYSRVLNLVGLKRFIYEDDYDDARIDEGRDIITRERNQAERRASNGLSQSGHSNAGGSSRFTTTAPVNLSSIESQTRSDSNRFPTLFGKNKGNNGSLLDEYLSDDEL